MNVQNKKVLDVKGRRDVEGQTVWVWRKNNGPHQRWKIVYEDEKKVKTSGMNEDFGFKINEPFFIVSMMPMRRVVRTHTANGNVSI